MFTVQCSIVISGGTVTMPNVLSVENLSRKYGDTIAVDGISFDVERNEIVGLLGPNGAGKTTTINMVLSVLEPTSGSIHIEGIDVARQRSQALDCTNFAAVYAPLPGNLTVYQNLRVFGLIYGVRHLPDRIESVLENLSYAVFGTSNPVCFPPGNRRGCAWRRRC